MTDLSVREGAILLIAAAVQDLKNVEGPGEFMDWDSYVALLDFMEE